MKKLLDSKQQAIIILIKKQGCNSAHSNMQYNSELRIIF